MAETIVPQLFSDQQAYVQHQNGTIKIGLFASSIFDKDKVPVIEIVLTPVAAMSVLGMLADQCNALQQASEKLAATNNVTPLFKEPA